MSENEWAEELKVRRVYKPEINVYQAAQKRIAFMFENFKRIYLSFSGGKDSGVMLNMTLHSVPDKLMDSNRAPSYKAIAIAILKNDAHLHSLGFTKKVSAWHEILIRENSIQGNLF